MFAQIAQSVEQGTENPRVGGSIPPLGTRTSLHGLGSALHGVVAEPKSREYKARPARGGNSPLHVSGP